MVFRLLLPVFLTLALTPAALAQRVDGLLAALRLGEVLEVMAMESARQAAEIDQTLLQGQGGGSWMRTISQLNAPDVWAPQLGEALEQHLSDAEIDALNGFFASERGQTIVGLEISARRALLDEAVEDAGRERWLQLQRQDAPLIEDVTRFVEVNNLVDSNVIGAMNAQVAFLTGLSKGTGEPQGDVIAEVWAQEPDIRASTEDWVFTFLTMAYAPLSETDMETYIAFSESPSGQAFNSAIMSAFDAMFVEISYETGRALGLMLSAEDI